MKIRKTRLIDRMGQASAISTALILVVGFLVFVALGAAPFRLAASASNAITSRARFTDGNVTVSSRYQGSPTFSPGGSQTFTLTKEIFNGSADCSTGAGSSATVTGVGNPSPHSFALASDGSAKLTAPQVSDQNGLFAGWSSPDGGMFTQIPGTDGRAICVTGDGANHTYVATYSPGVIVLDSTCATPVTSTNLGCTVCAKVFVDDTGPGTLAPLRVQIGDFNGFQRNDANSYMITANLQTFTFTLPSTPTSDLGGMTVSNIGTWFARVIDVSADGRSNYANFDLGTGSGCGGCTITCPANITKANDPNQCGAVVTYSAPTITGACGTVTCTPASGSFYPVGSTTVTCTAAAGSSCTLSVTVQDTQLPSITCPANVAQPTDPNQCSAVVDYPGPVVSDNCPGATFSCSPSSGSTFPKGATTVTCTATDASSNSASCTFTVTVNDTQAPTISNVSANPTSLWPPNHKMVNVTISYSVADNCDPASAIVCDLSVSSNEPPDGTGDGHTSSDWQVVDAHHVRLRAERSGTGSGRVYTITITCQDSKGNTSTQTVAVSVSHDQG